MKIYTVSVLVYVMETWIVSSLGWGNYSRKETIQGRKLYEEIRFLWWCLYIILAALLHMFSIFFREGLGLDSLSTFNAPLFGCTFFNELGVHFTKLARQFHGGPTCQKTSKSLLPFLLFLTIFIIIYHGKKSREEKNLCQRNKADVKNHAWTGYHK